MNPIQAARKFDPQIGRYRAAVAEDTSEGPRGVIIPVAPFVRVRLHRIVGLYLLTLPYLTVPY